MAVVKQKVVAYITHGGRLLVFRHTDFPEAGIQVPAGTVEAGETLDAAALREAQEETGVACLSLVGKLGETRFDPRPWGRDELHHRTYYHLAYEGTPPDTWQHGEMTPSDGSAGPIRFEFFWVDLPDGVPRLAGRQDEMLGALLAALAGGRQ